MAVPKPTTHSTLDQLMRDMRSPNGFDPMPPSQHEWLIDRDEPAANRAIAWLWSKTIRPGRGRTRSPYARDERGPLKHTHAAVDLGWTVSNARTAFEKLAAQGRSRTDETGKIWLCGDVPEPRRINGEDKEKELCTYFLEPRFAQYLQGLQQNERAQRQAEFEQLQEYKRKLAAEALATARAMGEEIEQTWQRGIGFTPKTETRGRPKLKRPAPMLQLSLIAPPDFVQNATLNYARNSKATSDQKENGAAQNHHPYVLEGESFRELADPKNNELEDEVRHRIEQAGKLHTVGGRPLDARTVSIIAKQLQQLENAAPIKQVLDVLEDKALQLAKRPTQAAAKTWGWIVGIVKSEVAQRLTTEAHATDELLTTVRTAADRKAMR